MPTKNRLTPTLPHKPSKETLLDLAIIASVPAVLAAIHFLLSAPVRFQLRLHHGSVQLHQVYTSAFVHTSLTHLTNNISNYLILALTAYSLCRIIQHRKWFLRTFTLNLTLLPVLISVSGILVFDALSIHPVTAGFSGITAGFGGLLLITLRRYLSTRISEAAGNVAVFAAAMILATEMALIYRPQSLLPFAAVAGATLIAQIFCEHRKRGLAVEPGEPLEKYLFDGSIAILVVVLLAVLFAAMFPANIAQSGPPVNIWAHYVGFVYGGLLAIASSGFEPRLPRPPIVQDDKPD